MSFIVGLIFLMLIAHLIDDSQRASTEKSRENYNCKCPYCNRKYNLKDGYYKCECDKSFRKEGSEVLKEEETVEDFTKSFVILFAYLSKADGIATQNEIEFVNEMLKCDDYNPLQIKWCTDLFNKYKNRTYDKRIIHEINEYTREEKYKKFVLYRVLKLAIIDGGITKEQDLIISDIVSILGIQLSTYEEIKSQVKFEAKEDAKEDIMKNFVILCAYISKADNVVTQNEINIVNRVLKNNNYSHEEIKLYAKVFNEYKKCTYNKDSIYKIRNSEGKAYGGYYLYWLFRLALVDGGITKEQNSIISDFVSILEISVSEYEEIKEDAKQNSKFEEQNNDQYDMSETCDYYNILNINPGASKEQIKQAYKKLMKIYHPDMQRSKDLPEEIMKDIEEKCVKIQEAYEMLMKL